MSPVKVTLTATDKMSGVKSISWRVNDGDVYAYDTVATSVVAFISSIDRPMNAGIIRFTA